MSWHFVEEDQYFCFNDSWTIVVPWDKHPAYVNGLRRVQEGKSVDFIGVWREKVLFLIEMKDYRRHRGGRRTTKPEDPRVELELKVRSTVASLIGAYRSGLYDDACTPIVNTLLQQRKETIRIVLWLEQPTHANILQKTAEQRRRAGANFSMQRFKSYLKWLDARISFTSIAKDYGKDIPDLAVENLPGELKSRATRVENMLVERGLKVPQDVKTKLNEYVAGNSKEKIDVWLCRAAVVSSAQELLDGR